MNDERITIERKLASFAYNQKGFAIIPLVVLLLFGIAAGTLLVQNGVNFLPKAVEPPEGYFECLPEDVGTRSSNSCKTIAISHCEGVNRKDGSVYTSTRVTSEGTKNFCINFMNDYLSDPAGKINIHKMYCFWNPPQCSAQDLFEQKDDGIFRIKFDSSCTPDNSTRYYQIKEGDNLVESKSTVCNIDGRPCTSIMRDFCSSKGMECSSVNQFEALCKTPSSVAQPAAAAPAAQPPTGVRPNYKVGLNECTYNIANVDEPCSTFKLNNDQGQCRVTFSHCDITDPATGRITNNTNLEECKKIPSTKPWCNINPISATTPAAGTARKIQAKKCEDKDAKECATPNKGCYVIDTKPRCVFDKISCSEKETKWCQDPPDSRQGCEVKDVIIEGVNEGKVLQHTQCTEAKLGAGGPAPATAAAPGTAQSGSRPAAGAPAAQTGTQQKPGAQPAAGSGATDVICGKDKDGLDIPCYAIGVFNKEELTSREAQAKLASVNYAKFRKILDDEEAKIGQQVADQARKKIVAAEEAMKACLK